MRSTTVGWLISRCVARRSQEESTPLDQCWAPANTTHNAVAATTTPAKKIAAPTHTGYRTGARLDPSSSTVIGECLSEKPFKAITRATTVSGAYARFIIWRDKPEKARPNAKEYFPASSNVGFSDNRKPRTAFY